MLEPAGFSALYLRTAQARIWVRYKLLKLRYCTYYEYMELAREDAEFLLGFRI